MRNAFYSFLNWLGACAFVFGAFAFFAYNLKAFPDSGFADIPPVVSGFIGLAGLVLAVISLYARMRK
jgi:hypothetical protein